MVSLVEKVVNGMVFVYDEDWEDEMFVCEGCGVDLWGWGGLCGVCEEGKEV